MKCDSETEQRFRDSGARPFTYGRDTRKVTMSYWSLPEAALDDPDALKQWAELAYQAALRSPGKASKLRDEAVKAPRGKR